MYDLPGITQYNKINNTITDRKPGGGKYLIYSRVLRYYKGI